MRLFKATYKARDGSTKATPHWHIELADHLGIVRRFAAFDDKRKSEALGHRLEALVACRVAGAQPDPELWHWLEKTPAKLRERLVSIGLLDSARAAGSKSLTQHLADFEASLLAKNDTAMHVQTVVTRAGRVLAGCGFKMWSEIRADRVERFLASLRNGTEHLSIQTSNFYLQSAKAFCLWMVQNQRASESPLAHLKGMNVELDRRRERVAFEIEEVRRLLTATVQGPERYGMDGRERGLLYRLAVETGLRRNELKTLKVSSFDLAKCTVTVEAKHSKHRREDVLPLRPSTAEELRTFFAGKLPGAKAFGGRYVHLTEKTAPMLKADLTDAGISYQDAAGRFRDFHALRHTCASWLAAMNVHPKTIQSILRHGDINLTLSRYGHTLRGQEAEAVTRLPDLSLPTSQVQRATGTDGRAIDLGANLAELGAQPCTDTHSRAQTTPLHDSENAVLIANGGIRTHNPWFTKPELYH